MGLFAPLQLRWCIFSILLLSGYSVVSTLERAVRLSYLMSAGISFLFVIYRFGTPAKRVYLWNQSAGEGVQFYEYQINTYYILCTSLNCYPLTRPWCFNCDLICNCFLTELSPPIWLVRSDPWSVHRFTIASDWQYPHLLLITIMVSCWAFYFRSLRLVHHLSWSLQPFIKIEETSGKPHHYIGFIYRVPRWILSGSIYCH